MKKILITCLALTVLFACKQETRDNKKNEVKIAVVNDEMLESAVIYEANIRQYSSEGTFDAFTKDIPQLKQLGVKIIWLMPIFPISETKRKATGGGFASELEDPKEREKALGSYYAVTNFTKINPEFGTIEDFRELVKTAHDNGIYIILDWVPNHTGWDHTWLKTNPEYYTQNDKGEVIHPKGTDWTDVADLNYDNKNMRKEMLKDMMHWIKNENIDGFRCDVAGSVPQDFWEETIPQLRAQKDIFMLAEAWEPELMKENLFDMAYGWDTHHKMNAIANGNAKVKDWSHRMEQIDTLYENNDILMNFVTNHDENSWNGTIKERMGDAAEVFIVLSYVAPGMPLIYSGQEYGLNHRLKFFEKDQITKEKGSTWTLLEKLGKLKQTHKALNGGKNAADYKNIVTGNQNILAFSRTKDGETIVYIANLSNKAQSLESFVSGTYTDLMKGKQVTFIETKMSFTPWQYKVLKK